MRADRKVRVHRKALGTGAFFIEVKILSFLMFYDKPA